MSRGTVKIVTQPWRKMERFIHLLWAELFGISTDYHQDIITLFRQKGIYYHRPFRDTRVATISLFPYRTPSIHYSIYQMKYRNKRSYIPLFGNLLAETLVDLLAELADTHHFVDPLLLVVPSSRASINKRGMHTNHELARAACKAGLVHWVEYYPNLLTQASRKYKQTQLTRRSDRLENPRGAYHLRKASYVDNRNIVLLDDVRTTGATVDEITRVLRASGARRVLRITLAH